jgi:RHS repeat-associated protein
MYTGREWDQSLQMYHYRARMYDANLGRFCSKDPIGYEDGKNLYLAYFVCSRTDPAGTTCEKGCCAEGISVNFKEKFSCGFSLDDYYPDYVENPPGTPIDPFWGDKPDMAGPFDATADGERRVGYKTQLLAEFSGTSDCKITQHYTVIESNFPTEKVGEETDDFEQHECDPTKPPFRQVCETGDLITWGDPLSYPIIKNDQYDTTTFRAVTKLTSCIHSSVSKCENSKCCIDWTWTVELKGGVVKTNEVVPGKMKCSR